MPRPQHTLEELVDGVAGYLRQAAGRTDGLRVSDPPTRQEVTALEVARDECREGAKLADRAYKRAARAAAPKP